ncbi:unnamed protein product, partial [Ectocarpus sp. 8 AP-2014]
LALFRSSQTGRDEDRERRRWSRHQHQQGERLNVLVLCRSASIFGIGRSKKTNCCIDSSRFGGQIARENSNVPDRGRLVTQGANRDCAGLRREKGRARELCCRLCRFSVALSVASMGQQPAVSAQFWRKD